MGPSWGPKRPGALVSCTPKPPLSVGLRIRIPRGEVRESLSANSLLGKITLHSNMTQQDIFDDIRDIFQKPMKNKKDFDFTVLQPTGGGSKTLTIPCHSRSFEWSATSIVSKNTKTPIYLLANEDIEV